MYSSYGNFKQLSLIGLTYTLLLLGLVASHRLDTSYHGEEYPRAGHYLRGR